jgi:hypothetical protein
MMATATESKSFQNISASTAAFNLKGGRYNVIATATGAGTMGLQTLSADGSTFIPVHTAFAAVTGFATADLPPGVYKFVISGFTAVFATIASIPA